MSRDSQLIFVGLMFAIAMAVIELAEQSWASQADRREAEACRDKSPEFRALMARAPGETHSKERCMQFMKYLSKEFVPEIGSPLPPDKMPK